jgi:hypothetical protein
MELSGDAFADRARSPVRELAAARTRRQGNEDDGIRDPIGHPIEVHQEVGEAITKSLLRLLGRIAGLR